MMHLVVFDPSEIIPCPGLDPVETKRSIFTPVGGTQSPVQSCSALEGMTVKNAFIDGLCCLIPSGMHSPCPFDL
jgi:hypothetical protein